MADLSRVELEPIQLNARPGADQTGPAGRRGESEDPLGVSAGPAALTMGRSEVAVARDREAVAATSAVPSDRVPHLDAPRVDDAAVTLRLDGGGVTSRARLWCRGCQWW
jgi:hypothetical protein